MRSLGLRSAKSALLPNSVRGWRCRCSNLGFNPVARQMTSGPSGLGIMDLSPVV